MEKELSEWDGKSIAQIRLIYKLYQHDSAFIDNLVKIIKEPSFQKGATWLLKHHLENQHPVSLQDANLIYSQLVDTPRTKVAWILQRSCKSG